MHGYDVYGVLRLEHTGGGSAYIMRMRFRTFLQICFYDYFSDISSVKSTVFLRSVLSKNKITAYISSTLSTLWSY